MPLAERRLDHTDAAVVRRYATTVSTSRRHAPLQNKTSYLNYAYASCTSRRHAPLVPRYAYASGDGQEQTRFRSPYAPSIRPTGGKYLCAGETPAGKTPSAREYG